MIRTLWARLTSPDRLSIECDFGGVTFTAEGNQAFVLTAYVQWLTHLRDAQNEGAEAEQETHLQQLPHFRSKAVGSC